MSLNDITFSKTQGGLGRPLAGEDHISGFLFIAGTLPTGFTSNKIQVGFQLSDFEKLGITSTAYPSFNYHISEYFRIQPQGVLYVNMDNTDSGLTFSGITQMQNFANGKVRQTGVYQTGATFSTSHVTTIQSICTTSSSNNKPIQVLYSAGDFITGGTSNYPDLTSLNAPNVSVVIGQDGAGAGYAIYSATSKSVSCIGACLGAVSLAKVSENIGWISKFNLVTSTELDTLAFTDGSLYRSFSDSALSALDAKGYIFARKYVGYNGSFFNDSHTAISVTSDYAYIENNRTIDKAIRGVRTFLLPSMLQPIKVNSSGQLSEDIVQFFQTTAGRALEAMIANDEISAFSVVIDPTQNVLTTSKIQITLNIVPVGTARSIAITIGFTLSV